MITICRSAAPPFTFTLFTFAPILLSLSQLIVGHNLHICYSNFHFHCFHLCISNFTFTFTTNKWSQFAGLLFQSLLSLSLFSSSRFQFLLSQLINDYNLQVFYSTEWSWCPVQLFHRGQGQQTRITPARSMTIIFKLNLI